MKEKLPKVPLLVDLIQEGEPEYSVPEIRVWCHPHKIGKDGDDYYEIFDSFRDALVFINNNKEAESVPLIAFRGYEINIFEMKQRSSKNK